MTFDEKKTDDLDNQNQEKISKKKLNEIQSKNAQIDKVRKDVDETKELIKDKEKVEAKEGLSKGIEISNIQLDLKKLKFLVEQGFLTKKAFDQIVKGEIFNDEMVKEITKKIEEVIQINEKKNILPKELVILKEEYLTAVQNIDERPKVLNKVNQALDYLYQYHHGSDIFGLGSIFTLHTFSSDDAIVKIQETNIDIKNNLSERK